MFARVDLKTLAASQPGPLPFEIENLTTTALADLSKALDPVPAQFAGVGYWPVAIEPVSVNPRSQTLTGTHAVTINVSAKTVTAVPGVRSLTATEIAALPPISEAAINAERDRRLTAGITYLGFLFETDDKSRGRIDRSRISALSAISANAQPGDMQWHGLPVDFFWIAKDNTRVPMDAQTMVGFGNTVAAMEGMLIVAANDLKARAAAGENFTNIADDALWPPSA